MDKAVVGHNHPFKQVMAYVDRLHDDISKMALLIEQLMEGEDILARWVQEAPGRWPIPITSLHAGACDIYFAYLHRPT